MPYKADTFVSCSDGGDRFLRKQEAVSFLYDLTLIYESTIVIEYYCTDTEEANDQNCN